MGDLRDLVVEILDGRRVEVARDLIWVRIEDIMRRKFAIAKRHLVPEAAIVADLGLD